MREEYKRILKSNRSKLVEDIDLKHGLWDKMRERGLVNQRIHHEIQSHPDQYEQVGLLLDHLMRGDDATFDTFCRCLKDCGMGYIVTDYLTTPEKHSMTGFEEKYNPSEPARKGSNLAKLLSPSQPKTKKPVAAPGTVVKPDVTPESTASASEVKSTRESTTTPEPTTSATGERMGEAKSTGHFEDIAKEIDTNFRENNNIEYLSLEEFHLIAKDYERRGHEILVQVTAMKIKELLLSLPGYIKENDDAIKVARDILEGNRGVPTSNTRENSEITKDITSEVQNFKDTKNRVAFLSYAPLSEKGNEDEIRRQQYEDFVLLYGEVIEYKLAKVLFYNQLSPPDGKSLLEQMNVFMQEEGCKATIVVIVFNGHGESEGMTFDSHPDDPIQPTEFLQAIHESVEKQCHQENPICIDVVLAQCYAHIGIEKRFPPVPNTVGHRTFINPDTSRCFEVTVFTHGTGTKGVPCTYNDWETVFPKEGGMKMKHYHKELRVYAPKIAEKHANIIAQKHGGATPVTSFESMDTT